jgi:hypothetical protein
VVPCDVMCMPEWRTSLIGSKTKKKTKFLSVICIGF